MKLSYDEWKRAIDTQLLIICGLTSDCLPDYAYRDAYDSNRSPKSVARAVIRAAKNY